MDNEWKEELTDFFKEIESNEQKLASELEQSKNEARNYLQFTVLNLFDEIKAELEKHGRTVEIQKGERAIRVVVSRSDGEEFKYLLRAESTLQGGFVLYSSDSLHERGEERMLHKRDEDDYSYTIKTEYILDDFLSRYQGAVRNRLSEFWEKNK